MTQREIIKTELEKVYGRGGMTTRTADSVAIRVEGMDPGPAREDVIRLTCWDMFPGGGTAQAVARRIEESLGS